MLFRSVVDLHAVAPVILSLVAGQIGGRKRRTGRFSRGAQMNQTDAGGRDEFGGTPEQFSLTDHQTDLLGTLLAGRSREAVQSPDLVARLAALAARIREGQEHGQEGNRESNCR
mgnify:CR=1 FL=1